MDPTEALARVVNAQSKLTLAAVELQAAVDDARADGFNWTEIAQALGVSRQAVWQRFARSGPSRMDRPVNILLTA